MFCFDIVPRTISFVVQLLERYHVVKEGHLDYKIRLESNQKKKEKSKINDLFETTIQPLTEVLAHLSNLKFLINQINANLASINAKLFATQALGPAPNGRYA